MLVASLVTRSHSETKYRVFMFWSVIGLLTYAGMKRPAVNVGGRRFACSKSNCWVSSVWEYDERYAMLKSGQRPA